MTTSPTTTEQPGYQPTVAQLERVAARRRFNWLYVYTPLIIASLLIIFLVGLLLWGTFSGQVVGTGEFASGLADIIVILGIMPLLLLCAILPVLSVSILVYRYQDRESRPIYGMLPPLLWRAENLVTRIQLQLDAAFYKVSPPTDPESRLGCLLASAHDPVEANH